MHFDPIFALLVPDAAKTIDKDEKWILQAVDGRNEARARGATVTVRRNAGDWASDIIVYESTQVAGTVK